MPGNASEGNGVSGSRLQAESRGENKGNFLEAVDILAVWIAEDVVALAKSFRVEAAAVLKKAVERIESDSFLEPGDSDTSDSGKETGGDPMNH